MKDSSSMLQKSQLEWNLAIFLNFLYHVGNLESDWTPVTKVRKAAFFIEWIPFSVLVFLQQQRPSGLKISNEEVQHIPTVWWELSSSCEPHSIKVGLACRCMYLILCSCLVKCDSILWRKYPHRVARRPRNTGNTLPSGDLWKDFPTPASHPQRVRGH